MISRLCTRLSGSLRFGSKSLNYKTLRYSSSTRQWSTPLAKNIAEAIATTGPISIAAFMRQCLTSPDGGYYTSHTPGKDQFGQKGDFVTSPEISQVFGELLGIWMVAEWTAQGKISSGVEIIEVGPGRGTLMDDMLRTISNFKPLASSIENIYLVEASPSLRETQRNLLCGDAPFEEIETGFRSKSKYSNLPITWYEDIRFVPEDPSKSPFIFAHEFFDALPIHAFQSVIPPYSTITTPTGPLPTISTPQWRELLVTPAPLPTTIKTTATTATTTPPSPEFHLSLSKTPTPSSLLLPTLSPRYTALLKHPNAQIEISPESHSLVANFARRIGYSSPQPHSRPRRPSGAALILDYGPSTTIPTSTLRGIRAHTLVSPLASPGLVDLSADVDFRALADAALAASPGVEVHGPVEQGAWLLAMGVRERAAMLCRNPPEATVGAEGSRGAGTVGEAGPRGGAGTGAGTGTEGAAEPHERRNKRIQQGVQRLIERGGGGMGRVYKAFALVPENGGRRRPVGFGGDV